MAASMCRPLVGFVRQISKFSLQNVSKTIRCTYSTAEASPEKSVEPASAVYPPIVPPLFAKTPETAEYKVQLAIQKMNEQTSVKDMLYELSKQQSWHYMLYPFCPHYSFLELYQHSTKTVMEEGLPQMIQDLTTSPEVEKAAVRLKPHIIDCILQEHCVYRHRDDYVKRDYISGRQAMENIMRVLLTGLIADFPHLRDAQIDQDVQVKSFWKRDETKYQFTGKPLFLVRTKEPLPEFILKDSELSMGEVPSWPFAPENVSVFKQHINPICFPGFKDGNPCSYGHTQVYMTEINRDKCIENKTMEEVLKGFGMAASFGWLNALALFKMYNPFRDVTQPITCQTIVTNGSKFSFFCYQLNTLALCNRSAGNPLRNVCWYTQDMALYDAVENGSVTGFNLDVLKHIVVFLTTPTTSMKE